MLGGNNSSEVARLAARGEKQGPLSPRGRHRGRAGAQEPAPTTGPQTRPNSTKTRKVDLVRAEKNLHLFTLHRANAVEMDGSAIVAVIAQHTVTGSGSDSRPSVRRLHGRRLRGGLAGADHEMTLRGHMGPCNLWNVIETDASQTFPRCPWALDLSDKPFPGRSKDKPDILKLGGWYWESGFDHDPIEKANEYIRDWNFRAMYGAWDAMKNVDHVLPNHKLNWAAFVAGKRESRRLLGDVILSKKDVMESTLRDGCVPTGWKIDLHLPDPATRRASRAMRSSPTPTSPTSRSPIGFPTAASIRATSATSSWPAAISASPTRPWELRGSCGPAAAWARLSAWPPRSAGSTRPRPAASTSST